MSLFFLLSTFGFGLYRVGEIYSLNNSRDKAHQLRLEKIRAKKKWVKSIENQSPEKALTIFKEKIQNGTELDRLAISSSLILTENVLHELSKSHEYGVVLTVIRNPKTSEATLRSVFENNNFPSYFFSDLGAHANTPEDILLKIYEKKSTNTGIEQRMASNPNLPPILIKKILKSQDPLALGKLAQNPSMNCQVVIQARKSLMALPKKTTYLQTAIKWLEKNIQKCNK